MTWNKPPRWAVTRYAPPSTSVPRVFWTGCALCNVKSAHWGRSPPTWLNSTPGSPTSSLAPLAATSRTTLSDARRQLLPTLAPGWMIGPLLTLLRPMRWTLRWLSETQGVVAHILLGNGTSLLHTNPSVDMASDM